MKTNARVKWFIKMYSPTTVQITYDCKDFTEILISEGGDQMLYRIYGNEKEGFRARGR